jgi:hypothetical protein
LLFVILICEKEKELQIYVKIYGLITIYLKIILVFKINA